jgi:protein-disulfide isomerase
MSPKQSRQTATKKEAQRQERLKKERNQRLRLLLVIVGGALLIVAAIVLLRKTTAPKITNVVTVTPKSMGQVNANNAGDPNAPVKIVIFSDFQCPYCKEWADQTEQAVVDAFVKTGKAYLTYRSMGNFVSQNIGGSGTESRDAAEAAYCAGDQGKFWEMHDALFANWQGEEVGSFASKRLTEIGATIGLDATQFNDCIKSKKYRSQVNLDYQDGIAAGVTGTPSFVINGKLVEGALPIDKFQAEVEAALKAASN